MVAEALTKNAKKCSEKQAAAEESDQENIAGGGGGVEPPEKLEGSECPLMRGFSLQADEDVEEAEEEKDGKEVSLEEEEVEGLQEHDDEEHREVKVDEGSTILKGPDTEQVIQKGEISKSPESAASINGMLGRDNVETDVGPSVVTFEGVSLDECSRKCHSHPTCRGFSFR